MKSKLLLLAILFSVSVFGQSVPNTGTFSLQDVTNVTGGNSLSEAFGNSVDRYFDFRYKGNKRSLSNFRNYTTEVGPEGDPIIATHEVTNISSTTATANGNLWDFGPSGPVYVRGFVYNTVGSPTIFDQLRMHQPGIGLYSTLLTGLLPGTTYYVRAWCSNDNGDNYGGQVAFTTLLSSSPPTLTTSAASNITPTTAVSGGNITDGGGSPVTERGIVWKIASSGTPDLSNYDGITSDGSGPGSYSSALSGLTPGTTYNVRAYATNSQGTAYGGQISFTTAEQQVACNADASYKAGVQSFPSIYAVTLGSGTGIVTFNFNALGIPDKFIVIYDGNEVINTGYRGNSIHQESLNTALGTPETITEPGSGTETFNKTSSSSVATVYVYAPLSGTRWNFQMSCPGVPLARVIYEPVQVDLKSESVNNLKDNENLIFREGMYWKAVGIQTGQDTIIINK